MENNKNSIEIGDIFKGYENVLSFKKILDAIFLNIGFISVIWLVLYSFWAFNYYYSTKIFKVKSLIQIESSSADPFAELVPSESDALQLDEQIQLYKSRNNLNLLIKENKLNVLINDEPYFKNSNLVINYIEFLAGEFDGLYDQSINFKLADVDGTSYKIFLEDDLLGVFEYKTLVRNNFITLNIEPFKDEVNVTVIPTRSLLEQLDDEIIIQKLVQTRFTSISPTLLEISINNSDIDLAKLIINQASNIFIRKNIMQNSEEAKNSLEYINNQIASFKYELNSSENKLNLFKQKNLSINFGLEVESLIEEEKRINEIIQGLQVKKEQSKSLYKESNPIYIQIVNQVNFLKKEKEIILKKINALPDSEKEYINLFRNYEINKNIYEQLLNLRLEFSLKEASTIANVTIIDKAYLDGKVSPKGIKSLIPFTFIVIIISLIVAIIRYYFFIPIRLPNQIDELVPLGILPFYDELAAEIESQDLKISDAADSLTTNLLLTSDGNSSTSVVFIGATPKTGKTTVSYITSEAISKRGKKTILIDCDYKRGDLHKIYNIQPLDNIDFIEERSYEQFKIHENLYLIPRPKGLSDSSLSIFSSKSFEAYIAFLKKEFDFVIFDTPPILSISDALTICSYAEIKIPIVRANHTTKREFLDMINILNSTSEFKPNYYIYNGHKKTFGYSYYGYQYQYYSYAYNPYDYQPNQE